ncbi:MAG: ABC transporter permease, partial [Vicinamibacteria bacterium]|nr:ABC transporter permease [Vicinamibacteria bacterium]
MGSWNVLRVALIAIRRNLVRSGLTMLGVIIGVASVIAMVALGSGARASIDEQISSQGVNLIYLSAGSWGRGGPGGGARGGAGSTTSLTVEDADAIRSQVALVDRLSPGVRGRAQVIAGNQNWNTSIEGGNEDFLAIRSWRIAAGENFTARHVLVADKVCLLGKTVADLLFPGEDPIGQIVRVRNLPFRVIGVLAPKGQGQMGDDQDDIVIAPYTTIQKKLLG